MKMIFSESKGHVFTGTFEESEKAFTLDAIQRYLLYEANRIYEESLKFGYPLSSIKFKNGETVEFVETLTTRKKHEKHY